MASIFTFRKVRLSPRRKLAVVAMVIVFLYVVVDVDLLPRLVLPPSTFSDWYSPQLARHRALGLKEPIHPHPFSPVLQPQPCPPDTALAIYVHSAPANLQRRDLIRATWGHRDLLGAVRGMLVFVLGEVTDAALMAAIRRESQLHGDLVIENFRDSYFNLTLKSVAGLSWVAKSCSNARFVLKTDDDVLVDIAGLVAELTSRYGRKWEAQGALLCSLVSNPPVNRQWWSKWYVSKTQYPPHTFGAFCEGAAFVLSADVVAAMAGAAKDMPFFPLDDVFVTGMLAEKLGIRHKDLGERFKTGYWPRLHRSKRCLLFVVEEDPLAFLASWRALEMRAATDPCAVTLQTSLLPR